MGRFLSIYCTDEIGTLRACIPSEIQWKDFFVDLTVAERSPCPYVLKTNSRIVVLLFAPELLTSSVAASLSWRCSLITWASLSLQCLILFFVFLEISNPAQQFSPSLSSLPPSDESTRHRFGRHAPHVLSLLFYVAEKTVWLFSVVDPHTHKFNEPHPFHGFFPSSRNQALILLGAPSEWPPHSPFCS